MGKSKILMLAVFILLLFTTQLNVFAIPDRTVENTGDKLRITSGKHGSSTKYDMNNEKKETDKMGKQIKKYQELAAFFGGLATITMVGIFMRHCIKLAVLGTEHWAIKRNSIMSLLWSGLAAALLGSMTTLFVITYRLFQ